MVGQASSLSLLTFRQRYEKRQAGSLSYLSVESTRVGTVAYCSVANPLDSSRHSA